MAWSQISSDFIQYQADAAGTSASGYFLKCYAAGTTTPILVALDSAGSTQVAKVELDSEGFAQNASGGSTAVYVDQAYRLVLYTNSTDADANTFASAVQDIDNLGQVADIASTQLVKNFSTLAVAVADTSLVDGDTISIKERTTGNGGGGIWDVVLSSTVTENTYNIVQCTGVATLSLVLRDEGVVRIPQFGITTDAVQAAIDAGSRIDCDNTTFTLTDQIELPVGRDTHIEMGSGGFTAGANVSDTTIKGLFKLGTTGGSTTGDGTEKIVFSGGTIDAASATYTGNDHCIHVDFAGKVHLINGCRITGAAVSGVKSTTTNTEFYADKTTVVDNCTIQGLDVRGGARKLIESDYDSIGSGSPSYIWNGHAVVANTENLNQTQGPQIRQGSSGGLFRNMGINTTGNCIVAGNSQEKFIVSQNWAMRDDNSLQNNFAYNIDITVPGTIQTNFIFSDNLAIAEDGASWDDGYRFTGCSHGVVSGGLVSGTIRYGCFGSDDSGDLQFVGNHLDQIAGDGYNISSPNTVIQSPVVRPVMIDLTNGYYQWTASASGTSEYYLEALGGGDPSITQPGRILEIGTPMTDGTAGTLAAGEWDWADNDTLGYSTVYVRLTDSVDPDTKGLMHLETVPTSNIDYVRYAAGTHGGAVLGGVFYGNGVIVPPNDTPLYIGESVFPNRKITDNVFDTGKIFKQTHLSLETTGNITLGSLPYRHLYVDTSGANKTVTLPDIDNIGMGQEIFIHKIESANGLTITADTGEFVNDGTTNANSISNIINNTNTGLIKLVSSRIGSNNTWMIYDKFTAA